MSRAQALIATLAIVLVGLGLHAQPSDGDTVVRIASSPQIPSPWVGTGYAFVVPPPTTTTVVVPPTTTVPVHRQHRAVVRAASAAPVNVAGLGPCGGDLPPCSRKRIESHGDYRIWNGGCYAPVGWKGISPCGSSSASGGWQITRGTWAGYGGYVNAADAPPAVQDAKARLLWAGGRGCHHWDEC